MNITHRSHGDEQPVISGGVRLDRLDWQPGSGGVIRTKVPENLRTEEIFVNGAQKPELKALTRTPVLPSPKPTVAVTPLK